MKKKIFYDTESCKFFSPTILIQYAVEDGEPIIHDIFHKPVQETLDLIEMFMDNNIIGFNLAHDQFHLSRTYGVLSLLPKKKPPKVLDIYDLENTPEAHDNYCLNPHGSLDLMLWGRQNELQTTMNRRDIIIKRIPKFLAPFILKEVKKIDFNGILFAKSKSFQKSSIDNNWEVPWKLKPLVDGHAREMTPEDYANGVKEDPNFVNIRLKFNPSTGLKPLAKYLLGHDIDLIEDMLKFKDPVEYSWFPSSGGWIDVLPEHIWGWTTDQRRRKYAKDDVIHTRDLYKHFNSPTDFDTVDSVLACSVGATHWHGFSINKELAQELKDGSDEVIQKVEKKVNFRSPQQVIKYFKSVADEIEKDFIESSSKEHLQDIIKDDEDIFTQELKDACEEILRARKEYSKSELLRRILLAKRLYVTAKVVGTKSNRMSGGSFLGKSSINPQGIPKEGRMRQVFPLKPDGWELSAGDFDSFEVSIAEAVYGDAQLREDLLTGKSIHAMWGSFVYEMSYEDIVASKGKGADDPEGYYQRSKNSLFAQFYGAEAYKISETLKIPVEQVKRAIKYFEDRYPGIRKAREQLQQDFQAMSQPNGIGSEILWKDPKEYVESFLGFRRYFTQEFEVQRKLFELAQNPPEEIKDMGQLKQVKRSKERTQTAMGATVSSLYGSAFSIQASIIRAALNHLIQSPGGQITKELQYELWKFQPKGVNKWVIMLLNVHDEIQAAHIPELREPIKETVQRLIEKYKPIIPLISMEWKTNLNTWGDK